MAGKVRDQGQQTRRLAEIAERQLEATTVPVVRVMRAGKARYADMVTVNKGMADERLVVRLENRGAGAAGIEECAMAPGGLGQLASAHPELESPVLEPNGERDVDFAPSVTDKEFHATGGQVVVQVVYEAIGAGARYRRRTVVAQDIGESVERWQILREETPHRVS
jgi:hypothetical protein